VGKGLKKNTGTEKKIAGVFFFQFSYFSFSPSRREGRWKESEALPRMNVKALDPQEIMHAHFPCSV